MPSLKKNLTINISYQLFAVLIPLIVAPYVTRTIGPVGVGLYAHSFSIASCFALIGMLGIGNYGNRSIAASDCNIRCRSKVFWNIWIIQLFCTLFACLLYIGYTLLLPNANREMAIIHIITVICSAFDISWFFYGIEKFQVTVFRNMVIKLLNLTLIFLLVKNEDDLVTYAIIMTLGLLLNNLLLFFFLKKEIIYIKPSLDEIKNNIKPIIVLFFPVIAISIYKLMDKVMIGILSNTIETGYYEYAEKIIGLPGTIITAVGAVMMPRLSSILGKNDKRKALYLLQVTIEVMMFLTIGMAAGIFSVGEDFAPFFYGEKFSKTGVIMMALAPSVIFQGWANVIRTEYLIPEKKDTIYVKSAWLGAIVNLFMNILLIPKLNAVGAAIGTVCAEGAVAVYQSVCARIDLPIIEYLRNVWIYFISAIFMWISVKAVGSRFSSLSFAKICNEVLIGMLVYCLVSAPYILNRYKVLKGI